MRSIELGPLAGESGGVCAAAQGALALLGTADRASAGAARDELTSSTVPGVSVREGASGAVVVTCTRGFG